MLVCVCVCARSKGDLNNELQDDGVNVRFLSKSVKCTWIVLVRSARYAIISAGKKRRDGKACFFNDVCRQWISQEDIFLVLVLHSGLWVHCVWINAYYNLCGADDVRVCGMAWRVLWTIICCETVSNNELKLTHTHTHDSATCISRFRFYFRTASSFRVGGDGGDGHGDVDERCQTFSVNQTESQYDFTSWLTDALNGAWCDVKRVSTSYETNDKHQTLRHMMDN